MSTFIGDYQCRIDPKSRIVLPSAFIKQMPDQSNTAFVIKKDIFEECLILYPIDEWERQLEIIRKKINPYNKQHNQFLRGFFKGTAEVTLDATNRLLIPKRLLDLINADKDIYLAGQDRKIEIWAKEKYETINNTSSAFAEIAEGIFADGDFLKQLNNIN